MMAGIPGITVITSGVMAVLPPVLLSVSATTKPTILGSSPESKTLLSM